jgi:hypothetical protein
MRLIVRGHALASANVKSARVLVALPFSLVLVLAACGGSESGDGSADVSDASGPTTASTTIVDRAADDPGDVERTCAELQAVRDLSDGVTDSTNDILIGLAEAGADVSEADTLAAFLSLADDVENGLPELLAAYDRAAAAAPADVAVEIRAVADGTAILTPLLAAAYRQIESSGDLADLDGIFNTPQMEDAARRAGISSLRLDNFTNTNCGFQFSNA